MNMVSHFPITSVHVELVNGTTTGHSSKNNWTKETFQSVHWKAFQEAKNRSYMAKHQVGSFHPGHHATHTH
eukprot:1019055-Ditylum_brightwellii.AAC.1